MRIKKAIEILQDPLADRHYHFSADFRDALKMSIKALQILSQNKVLLVAASFLCEELKEE